jgi:hypothetical protein
MLDLDEEWSGTEEDIEFLIERLEEAWKDFMDANCEDLADWAATTIQILQAELEAIHGTSYQLH